MSSTRSIVLAMAHAEETERARLRELYARVGRNDAPGTHEAWAEIFAIEQSIARMHEALDVLMPETKTECAQ